MPAISFQNVSKTYAGARGAVQALSDVSFDIEPGEFFGLLGPNGAGKTTLISILAGLSRASGGRVTVMGHDVVADYAAARRSLGIVPQELVFDPSSACARALRIQSGYFGVKNNDAWIAELLENLGLADKADANMRQLSGGMKRRVLVAQALVHRPPVIVLDETDRRRRRRTAPDAVAVHGAPEQGRAYRLADHPLPRGGRGAVPAHRHAQAGPRGGAGPHLGAAGRHGEHHAALQDGPGCRPRWRRSRASPGASCR